MIDLATNLLETVIDSKAAGQTLSKKQETSALATLRQAAAGGVSAVFITPKVDPDETHLDWPQIVLQTKVLQEAAQMSSTAQAFPTIQASPTDQAVQTTPAGKPPIMLYPGAELALKHRTLDLLEQPGKAYGLAGSHYLLVRMQENSRPDQDYALLYELMLKGYRPILAAPETSRWVQAQPGRLLEWMQHDVLIQVDLGSLKGERGEAAAKIAASLVKRQMVSFWGTHAAEAEDYKRLNPGGDAWDKQVAAADRQEADQRAALVLENQIFYQKLPHRW